ncbi:MAG: hypothetical protein K2I92_01865 [Muribaculaceae bacterium]|nr:hypothetical protein [Muribaculaceae bacterium]
MKRFLRNLCNSLLALGLTTACSQSEEPLVDFYVTDTRAVESESVESGEDETFFSSSVGHRMEIAQWLAKNYTLKEAKRIHMAVKRSLSMGLDEIYYLKEYASLSPSSNKVFQEEPSEVSRKFRLDFQKSNLEYNSENSTQTTQQAVNLFNHERLEIYWPYSDNWDGVTTPVVAYAPKSLSALHTIGYIYTKMGVPTQVRVDEAYCQQHPVWLITESETPYSLLPNFAKGETVSSDGIYYSPCSGSSFSPTVPIDSIRMTDITTIITLRLGTVRSEKNHDSWIAGGSEYLFSFASLDNANLRNEADTVNCSRTICKTKISFTRKEIDKKTTKELKSVVVSDWQKNLDNIAMTLVEEDPGGSKKEPYEAKLTVTYKGQTYGFDISIPRTNLDDHLAERIYSRRFILSTNNLNENEGWIEDSSDDVYWTLPYKVGVSYDFSNPYPAP